MFTGIIETVGEVTELVKEGTNLRLRLRSTIAPELKVDQSVAHNGVCLTVVEVLDDEYEVVGVEETLRKTDLFQWKVCTRVNLERCLRLGDRLDGHMVQGHVDTTGKVVRVEAREGSWNFYFTYDPLSGHITVPKGSICVNGVSLTVVDSSTGSFSVTIIPYTYEHTGFHTLREGDTVNLEFDIVGKYVARLLEQRS